jgi:hypothetical protein
MTTEKELYELVDHINDICKMPRKYSKNSAGKHETCIGHYHLSFAYGGVTLHQIVSGGGAIREIFSGHMPKSLLREKMLAFIAGVRSKADNIALKKRANKKNQTT